MQITLVSHYGPKPLALAAYVQRSQAELQRLLSSAFVPYAIEQVHATIIGLEGCRRDGQIENRNDRDRHQRLRPMNLRGVLDLLRGPELDAFDVKIGGYRKDIDYGFLSQGQPPHERSFAVRGAIAVAMGWPADGANTLDKLRRSFNAVNVWHKWHRSDADVDNDFFFVLGRIDRERVSDAQIEGAQQTMRALLAQATPVTLRVAASTLRVVCYSDPQLPVDACRAYLVDDPALTATVLARCYDDCEPTPE